MAKDWITGRSWNTGGGGGSPFAMAAIGLLQALQNNRREDERKEEYERMMQEKKAMQEIQTGRTLMERIAQMDPALWGDQGFVDAWKAGDTTYLAKIGWKPQQAAEVVEEPDYEKTFKQNAYKKLQAGEELTEQEKIALKLAAMPSTGYGTASEGAVIYNRSTGQPTMKNQKTFRPSGGGGGGGGGGGKGDDKEPNGLKRTDMDSVERWLFGGGYDPISGTMSPSWLDSMKKGKRPFASVLAGIKNRYGSNPGLYNYAVSRVMGDPMSPYYGEGAPPPQPSPQPEPAPIPAKEPTVAGTEPTPKPQTKPSPTYWGLGTQFQEDNRIPIARAKYNALIVKANGDQRLIAQIKMKYRPE